MRVEKHRNPLVVEEESVSPMTKTSKILKFLISVVNDHRKEISRNSCAEI